ncbi:hypothetical protein L6R52_27010 [Myxococcota bacterium]|nr:hypothetical protein [Myxococcota bacterium]
MDLRPSVARALTLATLLPALTGCELIESVKATTIVGGILVATPEVKLAGQFDVASEVVATAFVGERASSTSTEEPTPIRGADVRVAQAGGASVNLTEQPSPAGFYLVTSKEEAALTYADGATYAFGATVPGDTVEFGGTVTAPTRLSDASLTLTPTPGTIPNVDAVRTHPKNADLTVAWQAQNGRYGYVTVLRADPASPDQPQVVFDNRPKTAGEILEFIVGTPPTNLTIPGATFADDAGYAVIVVTLNRGDVDTNTFLGSPILAGSGAAVILAVGDFRP